MARQSMLCTSTNWLYYNYYEWTLAANIVSEATAFSIWYDGRFDSTFGTSDSISVKPVAYLKSNVKITSGTGTSSDPYQLSL